MEIDPLTVTKLPSTLVTQGVCRGRPSKKKLVDTSAEIREMLIQNYQAIVTELNRTGQEFNTGKIIQTLVNFSDCLGQLKKLDWTTWLDEVLQVLKNCILFRHTFKRKLDEEIEKWNLVRHSNSRTKFDLQAQQQSTASSITKHSFDILQKILDLISPKDAFNFFVALMSTTALSEYSLISCFENRDLLSDFRSKPDVSLTDLLQLIVASIKKSKCTLSQSERKVVAYEGIPYTSSSATAVRFLDEWCVFLLNTIQTPMPLLATDEVFKALMATVDSAPFLFQSMNSDMLRRLVELCISSRTEAAVPGIPVDLLLSLMALVVTVEWSEEDLIPNMTRIEFQEFAVSVCNEIISNFILDIKNSSSIPVEKIIETVKTTDAAIRVLVSCADHQLVYFQPLALGCFRLVNEVLLMESQFDRLLIRLINEGELISVPDFSLEKAFVNVRLRGLLFTKNVIKLFGSLLEENSSERDWTEEVAKFTEMWFSLFSKRRLFETSNVGFLSALIDCFSALNETLFETLNDTQQVFCIVNVLTHSRHTSDVVKTQGARAMAIFLKFKCLVEEEPQFLLDCLDTITVQLAPGPERGDSLNSRLINSRLVFSWAVSNLCDALAKFYSQSDHPSLGWNVYNKIYELGIRLQGEHRKMKYNANRALGALILWTPSQFLENPMLKHHVMTIAQILSDQLGKGQDFKARWNAAHALGNFMRKAEIWDKFNSDLQRTIFPAYITAIKSADNFKERIYCLKALQSLSHPESFGEYFKELFDAVLEAFKANSESKVPVPYGIFENYKEEVARTILHFAAMMTSIKVRDFQLWRTLETTFEGNQDTFVEVHTLILSSNKDENDVPWIIEGLESIERIIKEYHT